MMDFMIGDSFTAPKNNNALYTIIKINTDAQDVVCQIFYKSGKTTEWKSNFNRMSMYISDGDLVRKRRVPRKILDEDLFHV